MNENELKLMERLLTVERMYAEAVLKLEMLARKVNDAEIEDAQYREKFYGDDPWAVAWGGSVRTEDINFIMGWDRSEDAEKIYKRAHRGCEQHDD